MKIACIADLHGNWPATQALEKDLIRRKVDRVFCLGDIVGKGPSSDKTFDWAFANCEVIVGGNWDVYLSKQIFPRDRFYWDQLGDERLKKLRALPLEHHLTLSNHLLRMFHGRPITPGLLFPTAPAQELSPYFVKDSLTFQGIIYGDFHRSTYRVINQGLVINTGSVGNAMGIPKVFYILLEGVQGAVPAPLDVTVISLPYNNQQAIQDAENAPDLPGQEHYIYELRHGIYAR
ncbi:MAG: metallophosphoesterase family protein [Clostridiales bacterium]|nr:metallophosphoesterase family protein [Clostridiales bacterium]